jgi:hypothetical protein
MRNLELLMEHFKTDRASDQLASRNSFVFNTIKFFPNRYKTKLNPTQLIENKQRRSPQIATKSRFFNCGVCTPVVQGLDSKPANILEGRRTTLADLEQDQNGGCSQQLDPTSNFRPQTFNSLLATRNDSHKFATPTKYNSNTISTRYKNRFF